MGASILMIILALSSLEASFPWYKRLCNLFLKQASQIIEHLYWFRCTLAQPSLRLTVLLKTGFSGVCERSATK